MRSSGSGCKSRDGLFGLELRVAPAGRQFFWKAQLDRLAVNYLGRIQAVSLVKRPGLLPPLARAATGMTARRYSSSHMTQLESTACGWCHTESFQVTEALVEGWLT